MLLLSFVYVFSLIFKDKRGIVTIRSYGALWEHAGTGAYKPRDYRERKLCN